jgi:hypothetical protein
MPYLMPKAEYIYLLYYGGDIGSGVGGQHGTIPSRITWLATLASIKRGSSCRYLKGRLVLY